jgi:hypothetical protein
MMNLMSSHLKVDSHQESKDIPDCVTIKPPPGLLGTVEPLGPFQ